MPSNTINRGHFLYNMERPKNLTNEQWRVALSIYNSAKKQGDKFPELTVAQAALETGWFKHKSGKNNYFGQKATESQKGTSLTTTEVANNKYYKTKQKFRDYESIDEAMSDRVKKWSSKYSDAKTPDEALSKIWRYDKNKGTGVGYATDIKYGEKIKSILGSLGTALSDAEPIETAQQEEQTPYINPIDFNTPEYSGMTFSEEEPEQTAQEQSLQASQDLLEESFLEEVDTMLAQSQIQQEQPIQEYAPTPQYNVELNPIEYQPIAQFQDGGQIPVSSRGVYDFPNQEVIVPTEDGKITMKNIDYPIIGTDEFGNRQLMQPDGEYKFPGKIIHEIPQTKRLKNKRFK